MDNNQQPASNATDTPAPPSETPLSELNTTPLQSPPISKSPSSNAAQAAVPQSSAASNAVAIQNAVNATLQSQAQNQGIDQQSQYSPQTNPPRAAVRQSADSGDARPAPPQPEPASSQQPGFTPRQAVQGFTQKEVKHLTWRAFAKMAYIIIFIVGALGGVFFVSKKTILKPEAGISGDILLQAPYQPVLWKDFGEVFEPMIKMPLYYPEGFVKHEFLLDSGALVSSLPREEAKKMGISLAKLPRSTFGGFGGTTSFAYKSEAKIKLGEEEIKIPVVFTEAGGTKSILGRSGFFERYSIYFNSKREMIEIRK